MTTGVVDSITGTSGNDTIIADNTGANPQLSIADQIDGGAGTDTLKIYDNSAVPSITLTSAVQGIENVYVNDSNTEMTNNGSVDVSALTGVQNLTLDLFNLAANKLTVKAGDGVKYAFQNIASGNAASTIDLGNKTATSMDVEVNKVGDSTNDVTIENVTGAKVDTLNVTASGKSYIEVADTAGTLKTVNISGSADLTVTDVADATTIAITNTGKTALSTGVAKVSVTGGDAAETITFTYADTAGNADNGEFTVNGGKGDDTIVIKNYTDRGDLKDDKVTISGGDGNDTLSMTSELAADLSGLTASAYAKKGIANDFETLKLSNNASANGTVDLSILGSNITKVDYNQGIDYTQTLNGLASDGTVELSGAKGTNSPSLIVNVKDAAVAGHNSDVLNIVLNGLTGGSTSGTVNTVDYGSITAASVETVNIESTVDPTNTAALVSGNKNIAALTINNVQNVVIKGDAYLDISGTPLAGNSLAKIDASGNSAGVKMSTAGATQGIELIGTDAADDITGGNGADVITAGKGGDKVTGGQGDDTINLGAADGKTDTVVFRAAGTNGKDTINDFEAGNNGDVLKVTVLGTLVGSAGTYTTASSTSKGDTAAYKVIAITDNAASDWSDVLTKMNAALTIAGDTNAANAETAVLIDNGTDTRVYLFSDDSTNNTTVESSEITLVGTISGLGDVSDLVSGNFA
ncbi:hypothetical protein D6779_01375 [Candidatus Parcubacteria bacterium]|nr:MAG: hypothetical protein D6779_01375 [Candidatus Parcubacteria bacterium]